MQKTTPCFVSDSVRNGWLHDVRRRRRDKTVGERGEHQRDIDGGRGRRWSRLEPLVDWDEGADEIVSAEDDVTIAMFRLRGFVEDIRRQGRRRIIKPPAVEQHKIEFLRGLMALDEMHYGAHFVPLGDDDKKLLSHAADYAWRNLEVPWWLIDSGEEPSVTAWDDEPDIWVRRNGAIGGRFINA